MKVEIGPGNKKIGSDWTSVGVAKGNPAVDVNCAWGSTKLPFEDSTVDIVHACHVLEHIVWYKTVDALIEVYRILKKGGKLELHVPDFEYIVKSYTNKECGDTWMKFNPDKDFMTWVNGRIFTYGGDTYGKEGNNFHYAVFDRAHLTNCLKKAGFKTIVDDAPIRSANHGDVNLAITGIK